MVPLHIFSRSLSRMTTKPTELATSDLGDNEKQAVVQHEERIFETDAAELPPNYFKSLYFIGTMFAAQSAWAAVSANMTRAELTSS